jgi:hypothetical protein
MAIGIGLHCWYCEHGPCNGDCNKDKMMATGLKTKSQKREERIDLLTDIKFKNDSEKIEELKTCLESSYDLLQNADKMEDVYDIVKTLIIDTLESYRKGDKFMTL